MAKAQVVRALAVVLSHSYNVDLAAFERSSLVQPCVSGYKVLRFIFAGVGPRE